MNMNAGDDNLRMISDVLMCIIVLGIFHTCLYLIMGAF